MDPEQLTGMSPKDLEMMGKTPEKTTTSEQENFRKYETEAGGVELKYKEFAPVKTKSESDEVILYLPGAALDPDSKSVQALTQEYANYSNTRAFSVTTRIDNPDVSDSQFPQSDAVRKFIIENKLRAITVVGNSQGGVKAVDLVYLLQKENPDIKVNGLVLIGSGGLYEQDPKKLLQNFFKDATVDTPKNLIKTGLTKPRESFIGPAVQVGSDVTAGIVKEAWRAPRELLKRMKLEAADAARRNHRAEEIEAPVVIVSGTLDSVFDHKEIIPPDAEDQSLLSQQKRGEELKSKLFRKTKDIKVVTAQKAGHHGVQYFRPEALAKTTLYLLDRMKRKEK